MTATTHAACGGTGWFTIIDLDGAEIAWCNICNPDGALVPMPEPDDELRTQILAAVHDEINLRHYSRRTKILVILGLAAGAWAALIGTCWVIALIVKAVWL